MKHEDDTVLCKHGQFRSTGCEKCADDDARRRKFIDATPFAPRRPLEGS
jgi:hypothetical protein